MADQNSRMTDINGDVSENNASMPENDAGMPDRDGSGVSKGKRRRNEIRTRANTYFFGKVVFNLLLMVLGAVLIAAFLRQMQTRTSMYKQEENSALALSEAVKMLEENEEDAAEFTRIFHDSNQDVVDDLVQLFSSGLFESLATADSETRSAVFADIVERSGVQYLFLLSPDSKIVLSPEADLYGVNPAALGYMTQENVNEILKGTVDAAGSITPVPVGNQYGSFFFYSQPITYMDVTYMLVLGTDASVLEVQTGSLRDLSVVLSRAAIGNDGFLFAVDREDGLFLYYQHGSEVLTGQNALQAGLSKNALEDGYAGIETINGVQYYCVSRTFGTRTVVCAVTETDSIVSNDRHVLFWSTFGFVLVMGICLAYAVVVRNDFVRHATKTRRTVLRSHSRNPLYFDRSVFGKVFPLMLAGVMLMFGISFYTQTLLEISQGVDKSRIALDEVSSRYSESLNSREIIETYYNNRSLAKARLISFLIEEDPSVLNEATDHRYTVYTESGEREYLTDDEGNVLRSVGPSARLQELCDANDISSVYIFDHDGHTIGTNTANWFFILSHNPEAQSYPFLEVLDGRKESLAQEPMLNDLGEITQLIGVPFRYYTSVDENGETVYLPRQVWANATDTDADTADADAEITQHSSLLQIGLDENVSAKLLNSTDVDTILSTHMLSGGFIVMFDASSDHLCVYSPNEASIGKTAEDLGISKNAFTGNEYYGFFTANGVNYFSYFRYADGYFVGTALPRSNMFEARGIIALFTALTSFALILILSLTVTLTSKEEELLYATMSEDQASRGLNAAIFNVILPSGRTVATTKASARWDNRHIPWRERSPEQKLITMISVVLGMIIAYMLIIVVRADLIFQENSVIHYILSGNWDRGINVFALSASVLALVSVALLVALFRIPVRILTSLLGTRSETIGHLLLSVVKYGGAIGAIFYCLYLLGIESGSLLASAGILSLVIGLGAQSLIKDILAGIFIVFEGEFRVGDIITISGFRGTVLDIGLRTTKIIAPDGNIKIYNNSEISGVLNMTQQASLAMVTIGVEYGQDLDYVEAVMERDLPKLKENNPKILEGPTYLGVSELAESSVNILIMCKCHEADIKGVNRYLNREVLQIFYRNGINVPFPNVTVSQLNMTGRKTIEDLPPEERGSDSEG